MSLSLKSTQPSTTPQAIYDQVHKLLLQVKLSHYVTRQYAAHEAFGRIYDTVNGLIDEITEQLVGYSDTDPSNLSIGTVTVAEPRTLSLVIIGMGDRLVMFARDNKYSNLENLGQELSGAGAQLKYLSRFK